MLSRAITYTNPFTKEKVTETHWFHIPNADLLEMDMEMHNVTYTTKNGEEYTGLQAHWQKLVDKAEPAVILESAKDLIRRSYGIRDGDKFLQSEKIWENFSSTEAYSQLRWDLCTDAGLMGDFFNGIFSEDLQKAVAEFVAKEDPTGSTESSAIKAVEVVNGPIEETTKVSDPPQTLTLVEASKMHPDNLSKGLSDGTYILEL